MIVRDNSQEFLTAGKALEDTGDGTLITDLLKLARKLRRQIVFYLHPAMRNSLKIVLSAHHLYEPAAP